MSKETFSFNIGDRVQKRSGRPFKSTFKVGTIKEFCENEQEVNPRAKPAARFEEDDSMVSLSRLIPYKPPGE